MSSSDLAFASLKERIEADHALPISLKAAILSDLAGPHPAALGALKAAISSEGERDTNPTKRA